MGGAGFGRPPFGFGQGFFAEHIGVGLGVLGHIAAQIGGQCAASDDAQTGGQSGKPAGEIGFIIQGLVLPFPKLGPAPAAEISNREEIASKIFGFGKLAVYHAIKTRRFIAVAVFGIGQVVGWGHRGAQGEGALTFLCRGRN